MKNTLIKFFIKFLNAYYLPSYARVGYLTAELRISYFIVEALFARGGEMQSRRRLKKKKKNFQVRWK